MSPALLLASLWALAATGVAFLPMRWQIVPGLLLLLAAPPLLALIAAAHGLWPAGLALVAVLSVFRRPLVHLARRAAGRPGERRG